MIAFALGAVVLAGCSATASEADATASAALTAAPTPNGGILACSAMHEDRTGDLVHSVILLSNDNDEGLDQDRPPARVRHMTASSSLHDSRTRWCLNPHQMGPLLIETPGD